jgi:hypothetical protein
MKKIRSLKKKGTVILFFILLLSHLPFQNVKADNLSSGPFSISYGSEITIKNGTSADLYWHFDVEENERAIYWEVVEGNATFKTGWGSEVNYSTPTLDDPNRVYHFECHGYYAKYHVWSTTNVSLTVPERPGFSLTTTEAILFIGIPLVTLVVIGVIIFVYRHSKNKQDFF